MVEYGIQLTTGIMVVVVGSALADSMADTTAFIDLECRCAFSYLVSSSQAKISSFYSLIC